MFVPHAQTDVSGHLLCTLLLLLPLSQTLCVGMKLWGCVLEVSPESLTVSLPHGLRGTVAPKDTSDILAAMLDPVSKKGAALRAALPKGLGGDPQQQQGVPGLDQLFSVGQYVRCVVKELEAGGGDDVETAAADAGAGERGGLGTNSSTSCLRLALYSMEVHISSTSRFDTCAISRSMVREGCRCTAHAIPAAAAAAALVYVVTGPLLCMPEDCMCACVAVGGSRKAKSSKRIILSLKLKSLLGAAAAAGGSAAAMGLVPGQVVPAAVKSVEDRGYSLSFGIKVCTSMQVHWFCVKFRVCYSRGTILHAVIAVFPALQCNHC